MNYVTKNCEETLPSVLIEYLWKLVSESAEALQTFVLTAKSTGTADVQDILIRRGHSSAWRRVFGYNPVDATIQVSHDNGDSYMSLLPTPNQTAKETRLCSA